MKKKCPICKKTVHKSDGKAKTSDYYPFCSQRCRLIDLGSWLDSNYKISSKLPSAPEPDDNETSS